MREPGGALSLTPLSPAGSGLAALGERVILGKVTWFQGTGFKLSDLDEGPSLLPSWDALSPPEPQFLSFFFF